LLFHISEEPGIELFEPRESEYSGGRLVWAIHEDRLCNYLVPRACPRVTFYAGPETTEADVERFLGSSRAVVAVESGWVERLRSCRLYCYHIRAETFECFDECAGYYISRQSARPERVDIYDDLIMELLGRGVELRFVPNLWPLRDAVVSSTLQFSLIRMGNAKPR
jgi:hypothetical protein